jgi:hypothetical protein
VRSCTSRLRKSKSAARLFSVIERRMSLLFCALHPSQNDACPFPVATERTVSKKARLFPRQCQLNDLQTYRPPTARLPRQSGTAILDVGDQQFHQLVAIVDDTKPGKLRSRPGHYPAALPQPSIQQDHGCWNGQTSGKHTGNQQFIGIRAA